MATAGLLWLIPFTCFYYKQLRKSPLLLIIKHRKQCRSSEFRTPTDGGSTPLKESQHRVCQSSNLHSAWLQHETDRQRETARWNNPWLLLEHSQLVRARVTLKEERSVTYRGFLWRNSLLYFPILFSPKEPKTYWMMFCASSVHSMNTWVLENNICTVVQLYNVLYRYWTFQDSTVLSDVKLSDEINHLLSSINDQKHACLVVERALKHLNVKRKPRFQDGLYPSNLLVWID